MYYWKFLSAIFRQERHCNYANEAVNLLTQTIGLSPMKVSEIKWSWTVTTTGRVGKNIPVDLHMEHLNRTLKIMMYNLGSNISPNSVKRSSKTLSTIEQACARFREKLILCIQKKLPFCSYHQKKIFLKSKSS